MSTVLPSLPHMTVIEQNDLYAVGWVRTMDEVKEVLATFMGKTNLNYRMYRVVKNFGNRAFPNRDWVFHFKTAISKSNSLHPPLEERDNPDKALLPLVPFQGNPFLVLPRENELDCMFGGKAWLNSGQQKYHMKSLMNPNRKTRKSRESIKRGCPARIMIKEVFCFTDYQCDCTRSQIKKLQILMRKKLLAGECLNMEKRFYIRLPKPGVHKFHEMPPVTDVPFTLPMLTTKTPKTEAQGASGLDLDVPEAEEEESLVAGDSPAVDDVIRRTWVGLFEDRVSDEFGYVGTAERAEQLLKDYERATGTSFVPQKLSKELGTSEIVSLDGQKIIWEDGGMSTCIAGQLTAQIPYERFPFITQSVRVYNCEQGRFKRIKGVKHFGCSMFVKMKEIIVFPEYALPPEKAFDFFERVKMRDKLTADANTGRAVQAQRRIYIALPTPEAHPRHLHDDSTSPKEVSMDSRLWERMLDVFTLGVSGSDVITRHLHSMTTNELYRDKKPPMRDNRVFYPNESAVTFFLRRNNYTVALRKQMRENRVQQQKRWLEREESVSVCRELLHECDKMLYLITGNDSLQHIREQLEQLHASMKQYAPDMTDLEIQQVLPYIMDGAEAPTPFQRAQAAAGKGKPPSAGATGMVYSPPKKKKRKVEEVYGTEQNVNELTSLFSHEDSDDDSQDSAWSRLIETEPPQTEEAELAAAARSLVAINQPPGAGGVTPGEATPGTSRGKQYALVKPATSPRRQVVTAIQPQSSVGQSFSQQQQHMLGSLVSLPDPGTSVLASSAPGTSMLGVPTPVPPDPGVQQYVTVELPSDALDILKPPGTPVMRTLSKPTNTSTIRVIRKSAALATPTATTPKVIRTIATSQGQYVLADTPLTILNMNPGGGATEADLSVGLNIEAQSETSDVTGIT